MIRYNDYLSIVIKYACFQLSTYIPKLFVENFEKNAGCDSPKSLRVKHDQSIAAVAGPHAEDALRMRVVSDHQHEHD